MDMEYIAYLLWIRDYYGLAY